MESHLFVERRQLERFSKAIPIRFSTAAEHYKVEHDAMTVDLSSHGIRIGTAVPLSQGEQVMVLSYGDSRDAIPARVAWVREEATSLNAVAGLELLYSLPA